MRGGEGVSPFRYGRESRHMLVEIEPEPLAWRMAERQETRLCGAGAGSVRRDVLHRALKFGLRDVGILRRDLLVWPVFDAVAGELLPVARPIDAKPAIAVIDQQRPLTGGRLFSGGCWLISGCFLHVHRQRLAANSLFDALILGQFDGPGNEASGL